MFPSLADIEVDLLENKVTLNFFPIIIKHLEIPAIYKTFPWTEIKGKNKKRCKDKEKG